MTYYSEAELMLQKARKISRSQQRAYTMGILKSKQGGNCAVCGKEVLLTVKGLGSSYVLDHCHDTGLVRGVLHRGCNGALGKLENAVGRWTGIGMDMDKIIEWLKAAIVYYESGFEPVIYPDHKSDEEKKAATAQKAKHAAALKAARKRVIANKNKLES